MNPPSAVALGLAGAMIAGCATLASCAPSVSDHRKSLTNSVQHTSAQEQVDPVAAAQAMLDVRSQATLGRDSAGFRATIASTATPDQRQAQLAGFTASTTLPFRSWSLQMGAQAASPPAQGMWVVQATLSYALAGYDVNPVRLPRTLSLVRSGTGWAVAADTQLDAPWDFGELTVERGPHSIVIAGNARASAAQTTAKLAEAAVPIVSQAWGEGWSQRVVIVIPNTLAELEAEVGTTADLSRLAAVQSVELGDARTATGDRILLNPGVFLDKTSSLGQRVIMAHEVTHVASATVTSQHMPLWLVEGLADTVGFGTTSLTPEQGAPELAAEIKAGRLPEQLPLDTAFSADSTTLVDAYEQAWLACRLIANTVGLAGLVSIYRAVGGGLSTGVALAQILHTTLPHFTTAWRASLRSELS